MGLKQSAFLREKEVEDLARRSGFDCEEIRKWHRGYGSYFIALPVIFFHFRSNIFAFGDHIFRFMRDCPTGKLQKSEFVAIYKELFPNGNAKTFSEFIFNVFDADGNGTIEAGFQNKLEYHFRIN